MKKIRRIWEGSKKRKADKTSGIVGLTNDDYNLIYDQMEEVPTETCKKIDERNIDLVEGIKDIL